MSRNTLIAGAIAVLLVFGAVLSILISTRKNRVELTGEVLKVRSHTMDPEHTIVVIDFRVANPSTQQFLVREVEVFVEEPEGKSTPAELFAEPDAVRMLDYYKTLGKKYNPGLLRRDKINSGETSDRTVVVSAPMPDERLAKRNSLRIVIHDSDGAATEIRERRQ